MLCVGLLKSISKLPLILTGGGNQVFARRSAFSLVAVIHEPLGCFRAGVRDFLFPLYHELSFQRSVVALTLEA